MPRFILAPGMPNVVILLPKRYNQAVSSTVSTSHPIPKIEKSTIVYEGYYKVRVDMLSLPQESSQISYTTLLAAEEAAVVLAETEDGRFVINREYRHPTGTWLYALPGGRVDPGESPLATAQRELCEETGYKAASWHHIGTAYPMPALCGQKVHYYLAKSAYLAAATQKEPLELIATHVMNENELFEAIRSGAPTDGILLTALSFRKLFTHTC